MISWTVEPDITWTHRYIPCVHNLKRNILWQTQLSLDPVSRPSVGRIMALYRSLCHFMIKVFHPVASNHLKSKERHTPSKTPCFSFSDNSSLWLRSSLKTCAQDIQKAKTWTAEAPKPFSEEDRYVFVDKNASWNCRESNSFEYLWKGFYKLVKTQLMIFLNLLAMLVCESVSEIRCVVVPYKKGQSSPSLELVALSRHIIQHLKLQLSCPPSICNAAISPCAWRLVPTTISSTKNNISSVCNWSGILKILCWLNLWEPGCLSFICWDMFCQIVPIHLRS